MDGNIFNSRGIHVAIVRGPIIFDLKGKKLYDLKGIRRTHRPSSGCARGGEAFGQSHGQAFCGFLIGLKKQFPRGISAGVNS